jgi:zinc resistance-associated protein
LQNSILKQIGGKKMKKNFLSNLLLISGLVAILSFTTTAFAGWGRGGGGCGGQGYGYGQRGYGPQGYQDNLSDEEIAKLNEARKAFFEETSDLRDNLYQRKLELRAEMAKKNPDANRALSLQKEISDFQGQLAQKRIEHRLKMQKENPELFAGKGPRRGFGGQGGGRGFQGRGPCWY